MSEYCVDAPYVPPVSGSIVLNGWAARYNVFTDHPVRKHYPINNDAVALSIEMDHVRYEFLNGTCTAMVNGSRITPKDDAFYDHDAVASRGRARAQLLTMLYAAENGRAPGNVQTILRRGLGVDDMLRDVA